MRQLFVIAIATVLFVACNNNEKGADTTTDTGSTTTTTTTNNTAAARWPDSTRNGFINDCIGNSKGKMPQDEASEYCNCMLGKIEARYPNSRDVAALTMQEMQNMAQDCVK